MLVIKAYWEAHIPYIQGMYCVGKCRTLQGVSDRPYYHDKSGERVYCAYCAVSFPARHVVRGKNCLLCPCCRSRVRVKRRWKLLRPRRRSVVTETAGIEQV